VNVRSGKPVFDQGYGVLGSSHKFRNLHLRKEI
jgi:hypothetical protein